MGAFSDFQRRSLPVIPRSDEKEDEEAKYFCLGGSSEETVAMVETDQNYVNEDSLPVMCCEVPEKSHTKLWREYGNSENPGKNELKTKLKKEEGTARFDSDEYQMPDDTTSQIYREFYRNSDVPERKKLKIAQKENDQTAIFDCDESGAEFVCFGESTETYPQITLTVPKSAVQGITRFTVQQLPAQTNHPTTISRQDTILTNVVSLSPHKTRYNKPVKVELYFKQELESTQNIKVMYNEAADDEEPQWRVLDNTSPKDDDPTFNVYCDHVTMYFKHFCQVFVVKSSSGANYTMKIMAAGLKVTYQPRCKRLDVSVSLLNQSHLNTVCYIF